MKINSLIKVAINVNNAINVAKNRASLFASQKDRAYRLNLPYLKVQKNYTAPNGHARMKQLWENADQKMNRNLYHKENLENLKFNKETLESGAKGVKLRGITGNKGNYIKPSRQYS